jgi:hypothetical protein
MSLDDGAGIPLKMKTTRKKMDLNEQKQDFDDIIDDSIGESGGIEHDLGEKATKPKMEFPKEFEEKKSEDSMPMSDMSFKMDLKQKMDIQTKKQKEEVKDEEKDDFDDEPSIGGDISFDKDIVGKATIPKMKSPNKRLKDSDSSQIKDEESFRIEQTKQLSARDIIYED